MYKKWTLNDIKSVINEMAVQLDYPCNIPIFISKRAKKTLGAFYFSKYSGKIIPVKFVFAEKLISGLYSEETVKEVIIHEYLHYFCDTKTGVSNGHNKTFKNMCRNVGISDKATIKLYEFSERYKVKKRVYKIFCSKCGSLVGVHKRKDAADRKVKAYISVCCKDKLIYTFDFI